MRVHRSVIAIGLALTFCFTPRHAEAQPFGFLHWQGGSGDLLDANWHWEQQDADDEAPIDGDELNIGADGEVSFSGTFNPWVFRVGHPFPEGRPDLHGPGSYTQTGGSVTVSHHAAFGVEHAGNVELSGDASFTVVPPGSGGVANGTLHVGLNSVEPTTMVVKDNASVTAGFLPIGQFAQDPEAVPTAPSFLEIHDNASVTLTDNDRVIIGWFGNPETGNQAEGTLTMTGGTLTLQAAEGRPDFVIPDLVVGWDGIGTVNMSGGVIDVANSIVTAIAGADGARPRSQATINHSGGTINAVRMILSERGETEYNLSGTGEVNLAENLSLGVHNPASGVPSVATVHQTGGTMNVGTSVLIGEGNLGGTGVYEISGGVLDVDQDFVVGLFNGEGGFHVLGADGQISVGNDYFQDPNGQLFVQPDSAGLLSLIDVGGDALFHAGTTLEANFDNFPGFSPGQSWDVLTAAMITDNGINLVAPDPLISYRIVPGRNGEILQVFVIPEPASLALLACGLALAVLRRRTRP